MRSILNRIVITAVLGGIAVASCGSDSASPDAARTLASTVQLEPGEQTTEYVNTHCGYEWLLVEVNGEQWMTADLGADEAGNPTEDAWPQGDATDLELRLVDADTLEVTAPGTGVSHTYTPGDDAPGCE